MSAPTELTAVGSGDDAPPPRDPPPKLPLRQRIRPSVILVGAPAGPLIILSCLNGVDELGYLLSKSDSISAYEQAHR